MRKVGGGGCIVNIARDWSVALANPAGSVNAGCDWLLEDKLSNEAVESHRRILIAGSACGGSAFIPSCGSSAFSAFITA